MACPRTLYFLVVVVLVGCLCAHQSQARVFGVVEEVPEYTARQQDFLDTEPEEAFAHQQAMDVLSMSALLDWRDQQLAVLDLDDIGTRPRCPQAAARFTNGAQSSYVLPQQMFVTRFGPKGIWGAQLGSLEFWGAQEFVEDTDDDFEAQDSSADLSALQAGIDSLLLDGISMSLDKEQQQGSDMPRWESLFEDLVVFGAEDQASTTLSQLGDVDMSADNSLASVPHELWVQGMASEQQVAQGAPEQQQPLFGEEPASVEWTQMAEADPAPLPDFSLVDDKGNLNLGLVVFVLLAVACISIWSSLLRMMCALGSSCITCRKTQQFIVGSPSDDIKKPLLAEHNVQIASEHVGEGAEAASLFFVPIQEESFKTG